MQFVKIPLVEGGVIIGLSGFYWPVDETDSIVAKLLHILDNEWKDVLDDLPDLFHVIRKNAEKRLTFVNRRHAQEHGKPQSEFIGKTDKMVFEFDQALAKNYEKDDDRVLAGQVVARHEPHRSSAAAEARQVLTVKSPIHGPTEEVSGIQCIYWYLHELDELLLQTARADDEPISTPSPRARLFVSYARKNRNFLVGSPSDKPPIVGFESTLKSLQKLHRIAYWFDDHRKEDELDPEIGKTIQQNQLFVLLESPAFVESEYVWNVELPLIQSRRLNDDSVRILRILLQPIDYRGSDHPIAKWLQSIPALNEGNGPWRDSVESLIHQGKESEFWMAVSMQIRNLLSA